MKYVIKLTGKLFKRDNAGLIKEVTNIVLNKFREGSSIAVITGGGSVAREYVGLGNELKLTQSSLDTLGIEASRINALLLALALGNNAYLPVPRSIDELLNALGSGKIVVLGGLQPGQSTNAVAAIVAELMKADLLVNATVVDGVYDKDPRIHKDARLLKELSINELEKVITQSYGPGHYELLDPLALLIIKRSRIPLVFVNAFKPETINKALNFDKSVGTWVHS